MATTLPSPDRSRRAQATHRSLIEAAREVARRSGSLSPELVAETAQVSPATFYTYFSSKDEALAAAFDAVLSDMNGQLADRLTVEQLLEEGLETVVRDTVRSVARGFAHDARIFRLAISRLPESEMIREVYRRHEKAVLDDLVRFVRLGAAAHKIREADPDRLARALLVGLQGLQNPLLQQQGMGAVVDELAHMIVALLRPPSG